jgi:uncharacterized C2H2 Zn-finger protein
MSISSSDIVYVGYCPRCQKVFGHKTSKRKADFLRKEHLAHCLDVEPIKAKMMTREIETLILEQLDQW